MSETRDIAEGEATPSGHLTVLQPPGWKTPRGYANGIAAHGRIVFTGGLIGWNEAERFADGFLPQVEQALLNVLAVVAEAGGEAHHVARLTWYVRSVEGYRASLADLGAVYRRVMGKHYPAMALVEVSDLVEPQALVEIEATAVVPD